MINLYNQVPSVYTSASRDFQYLSWLINIVLNSVKHNVDDMYNLPNVSYDSKMSELLALTLGFKVKRNYDQKQLAALVAILPNILKYKGTITAIKMAAEALITASGALGDTDYRIAGAHLDVVLPEDLSIDTTLFVDLLDYILPAGMTCRVVRENRTERTLENIEVRYHDTLRYDVADDLAWEKTNLSAGLSVLFDADSNGVPEFTANFKKSGDTYTLNTGLFDNTIIPVLSDEEILPDEVAGAVELWSTETDEYGNVIGHLVLYAGPEEDNSILLKAKQSIQEL